MKNKILILLSSLLALAATVACTKTTTKEKDDILILSPSSKNVIAAGADVKVKVQANYAYTVTPDVDWVTPEIFEGYCMLYVDENTKTSKRSANVLFKTARGLERNFTLTQFSSSEDMIVLEYKDSVFTAEGGDIELAVVSNFDVTYTNDASWLTVTEGKGLTYTLSAPANPERLPRYANLTFTTARGASASVQMVQIPEDYIIIDKDSVSVSYKANVISVHADAYFAYTASPSVSWLSCNYKGWNEWEVKVAESTSTSDRKGIVVFETEYGALDTLIVHQEAADIISVSPSEKFVSPDAEQFDVTVTSVYEYNYACTDSWVTVTPGNNGVFKISVPEYTEGVDRTANVIFTSVKGNSDTLKVVQSKFEDKVALNVEKIEATYNGARITVKVTSNYPVTPSADVAWITAQGSERSFVVCVERNLSGASRSGKVTFTSQCSRVATPASATLQVSQQPDTPGSGMRLPDIDIIDIPFDL